MNTNSLSRFYDTLTPWERLPLLVAAAVRDDEVERARLIRAAPQQVFQLPDYWGLSQGLDDLVKLHLLEQLELAVHYWQLTARLDEEPRCGNPRRQRRRQERLGQLVRMLAYRCLVRADGWRLLCAELHLDPEVLPRALPGHEAVRQMEQLARLEAFSAEEAIAFLREATEGDPAAGGKTSALQGGCRIETAADVAASMREFLREGLGFWQ